MRITVYPCADGYHDFAVGAYYAVCNRCEKVVVLSAPKQRQGAVVAEAQKLAREMTEEFRDRPWPRVTEGG